MDPASKLLIGTSGYSFPDWVGPFYPPGTRRQEMFARYVRQFRTVELNYTFYGMPKAQTLERLVRASPLDFLFWVKANQRTTHEHDRTVAAEFLANLEPLRAGSRLAGVLMQFPQNFHRTVANRRVLRDTVEDFKAVPLAVEFRHGSWDLPAPSAVLPSTRFARSGQAGQAGQASRERERHGGTKHWRASRQWHPTRTAGQDRPWHTGETGERVDHVRHGG